MVGSKGQKHAVFAAFVLPALGLYLFFAMLPLGQGFWLSTTNWDGGAPWTPAQMSIADFESQILDRIEDVRDRDYLLKFYLRDEEQGSYRKQEMYGLDRYRAMRIINRSGYVNPNFANVGLKNYKDIFTGGIDKRFFPERYKEYRFRIGDPVSDIALIPKAEFEKNMLAHADDAKQAAALRRLYSPAEGGYALRPELAATSELALQSSLAEIPALEEEWEELYQAAFDFGEEDDQISQAALLGESAAFRSGALNAAEAAQVAAILTKAAQLGRAKNLVSALWYIERLKWGVLLFTFIFVVCTVILTNILALLLAIALDQGLRTRNVLRSAFFIPNVLSMIIVAFIWQLVFSQLMPAITGVREWMMNPDFAPWITIFVAVWQGLGYYTIIYLAGLQNVPPELLESAGLDGATGAARFFLITLPLLVPAITICLFLTLAGALKSFDLIFALYPSNSTSMGVDNIVVNIFYDAFRDKRAGLATAKAILLLVFITLVTGVQLVLTKRREVEL